MWSRQLPIRAVRRISIFYTMRRKPYHAGKLGPGKYRLEEAEARRVCAIEETIEFMISLMTWPMIERKWIQLNQR